MAFQFCGGARLSQLVINSVPIEISVSVLACFFYLHI